MNPSIEKIPLGDVLEEDGKERRRDRVKERLERRANVRIFALSLSLWRISISKSF